MKARLLLVGALAVLGCEAVISVDFDVENVECKSVRPPERPLADTAGEDRAPIIGVLAAVDFGEGDLPDGTPAYRNLGFDLDGICGMYGARPSCTPFAWAGPNVSNNASGRDNQSGALIRDQKAVWSYFAFNSESINNSIRYGSRAPLAFVRLTKYNGRVEDDHVELDWYVTLPFHAGKVVDDAGAPHPNINDETWPIWAGTVDDPGSLREPPNVDLADGGARDYPPSKFRDTNAFVRDFQIVARLPKQTPLQLASVPFYSDDLIVVIKLRPGTVSDQNFYIESGLVAGHVPVAELFKKVPRMAFEFGFGRICKNDDQYPKVKQYVCAHVDSHVDGRNEPDAPCDALSVGVGFTGRPGRLGAALEEKDIVICEGEDDPASDTCTFPAKAKAKQ